MEAANNGERHPAELKKQMREDKQREAKIQEQLNKQLNGLSLEEKFNLVHKRLVDAEKENKRLVQLHKQYERSMEASKKERENMILEHSKVANTKSRLEQLCRELQKQNRIIKDESFAKIKEEEEKRKETQAKFQKSLNEIQVVMNENNEKNQQLKDDNTEMAKKFKFILEQYELRDQQMDKMNKQMDLVTQLNEAKLAKANMETAAEKEKFLAEKEIIITELTKVRKQLKDLQMVEVHLREQVNMYSDKYGEFQDSLKKSQNIFVGYKGDMEKMSKKIRTLEKETNTWKSKWERSNAALIDLMSEKQVRDEHIMKTARQLFQLQKLCRTLQNERAAYFKALEENKVEIPTIVEVPCQMPEPEAFPAPLRKGEDRLEIMTKSCSALKENLAALQGQLIAIQDAETKKDEEVTAEETAKATAASSDGQAQVQGKKGKKDKKGKGGQTPVKAPEPETESKASVTESSISENIVNVPTVEATAQATLEVTTNASATTDANVPATTDANVPEEQVIVKLPATADASVPEEEQVMLEEEKPSAVVVTVETPELQEQPQALEEIQQTETSTTTT